jgi:hypothetical protein
VADTQEPATNFESEEIETPNAATQHLVAETQEPATNINIEIQESEVEGADILLSLYQEYAETQPSVAIPVAAPQEPAKETMTATQEPVIPKSKPIMADVLEENEFLKSQLEAYQQEMARARESYEKELSRYALERTTILATQTTESICKEYMCCQCGEIYYQAGYKIVQVPVSETAPNPSPFEDRTEPAVTQEPAGPSKIKTEPAETQEPAGPSKIKTEPAETQKPAGPSRIKKEIPLPTRLCKHRPWRKSYLPVRPTSLPPGNSPLKPCLVLPLQMLKHRLLTCGTNMLKYRSGRRNMLRHRTNICKYTGKPGGITLSRIGKHWT